MVRLGIHAAMLAARYPLPEALARAAELGAESYEIDIGLAPHGEPWAEWREVWARRLEPAAEQAGRAGIALPSLCLGALWQHSLASPDAQARRVAVRVVHDALGWARQLGASALLLPVGQPAESSPEAARAELLESLRRCLDAAAEAQVVLALENLGQPLLAGVDELLEVVEALASPWCGVYLDPGNDLAVAREPAAAVRRFGPHLARVHLKDALARPKPVQMPPWATGDFTRWAERTVVPLGAGEVAWPALARALAEAGYRGDLVIELPQSAEGADEGVRANLRAARRLLAPLWGGGVSG